MEANGLLTFSRPVSTQSFLAARELDDIHDFSLSHGKIIVSQFLYDAVRIHHHAVQHRERPVILGKNSCSGTFLKYIHKWMHLIFVAYVKFLRVQFWDQFSLSYLVHVSHWKKTQTYGLYLPLKQSGGKKRFYLEFFSQVLFHFRINAENIRVWLLIKVVHKCIYQQDIFLHK